ncbi:MAG: DUF3109 family protein [Bacteroidetes bacterium]|nr:DUF3109 family protein [Bacteroidota bacterium]
MEKYIIDDRIFTTDFSCNVLKCKGACCTMKGAGGAPLLESETGQIKTVLKTVSRYLCDEKNKIIREEGFTDGSGRELELKSHNDEDCIFSFREDGIARCSFERAFFNKEIEFRKPISCHLFPVRITGKKRNVLRYEEIYECRDAVDEGKEKNIKLIDFLKDSMTREFGKEFYQNLKLKFGKPGC